MLTEVDTRQDGTKSVSLYMDTDAQVYLVCVEGYEPITCLTRDRALAAYKHPYSYIPLERAVVAPNATEGSSHTSEWVKAENGSESLTDRTSFVLVELDKLLRELSDSDFRWISGTIADMIRQSSADRLDKPYNREEDIPF